MSEQPEQWFVGAQNDYPFVIDRRPNATGNDYPNHEADVQVVAKPFPTKEMTVEQVANLLAAAPKLQRELASANAQIVALRGALTYIKRRNGYRGDWPEDDIYLPWLEEKIDEALSSPVPDVVPLDVVEAMRDRLVGGIHCQCAADKPRCKTCLALDAFEPFRAKHPTKEGA